MWEDSLFEQPIRKLLHAAHANASLYALRSASHKLLNYAQSAREYLDFRYQGLTVAFENLEHNISRLEEDMTLLKSCQERVSDEIDHEVDEALAAADLFINSQQVEIVGAINAGLVMAGSWKWPTKVRPTCVLRREFRQPTGAGR